MNALIFTFNKTEAAVEAVTELRRQGIDRFEVMSPVPDHHLDEAVGVGPSRTGPVHWYSLVGAVVGCLAGWLLTIGTAMDYPLVTSGRDVVTPHVFLIIAYEMTLLTAIVLTVVGFLVFAQLPPVGRAPYHPAASYDKVVIVVEHADAHVEDICTRCGGERA